MTPLRNAIRIFTPLAFTEVLGGELWTGPILSGGTTIAPARQCADRQIRLWLHIDLTSSLHDWRAVAYQPLRAMFETLVTQFPNLKFGMSGFGDRPTSVSGQVYQECYVDGIDFSTPEGANRDNGIRKLLETNRFPWADDEEDPLTGLPWVAKHQFGDYKEGELRMFVMVTDSGPHYGPKYIAGYREPNARPEDFMTCDQDVRWATLEELFDPPKQRRVLPLVIMLPRGDCVKDWTEAFTGAGYESKDHMLILDPTSNPLDLTQMLIETINAKQCDPGPTDAPSHGTVPIDPQTTTPVTTMTTTVPTTNLPLTTTNQLTATGKTESEMEISSSGRAGADTNRRNSGSNDTLIIVGAMAAVAAAVIGTACLKLRSGRDLLA